MKIRTGFVSNSSSSSFVVSTAALTQSQIEKLCEACDGSFGQCKDHWNINMYHTGLISGYTSMNNGQDEDGLEAWLKDNGYPLSAFKFEHD